MLAGHSQPTVGELQGRRRAQGDSAREPLSQLSQALFQCLCALLQGEDMSTHCRSPHKLGLPSTAAPLPSPAQHPGQSQLLPWLLPLCGTAAHKQLHRVGPVGCTALINDLIPEGGDGAANVRLPRLRGGQQMAQPRSGHLTVHLICVSHQRHVSQHLLLPHIQQYG